MKVFITGTPLEALGWQRDLGKIRIVFRPDTSFEDQCQFLADLQHSAKAMRHSLIAEKMKEKS